MNYDYLTSPIRISVPSFKQSKAESNLVYFDIEIESYENKWFLEKKFPDFEILSKNLKSYHSVPTLPPKNYFFRLSQADLENRRKGLEEFLRKVVVRNDLMNSQYMKDFLQLDKNAANMIVEPPKLLFQYVIGGIGKGINDFFFDQEENVMYIATGDTNPISKFNARVSNTILPWENESAKNIMEVGSIQAWVCGDQSEKFMKIWSKGYPKEVTAIHYDPYSKKVTAGLQDGVVDIVQVKDHDYEDVACVKIHTDKVTGVCFDGKNNVAFSTSEDRTLRVSHGGSLALVIALPHKQPISCILKDTQNERLFMGTDNGQIYINDITHAQKPKLMNTLKNNYKGSIKSLKFDASRNYLFCCASDGEINVFDIGGFGKEKYAKMNATLEGKDKTKGIAWSFKRNQIITGSQDGSITFWNAIQGKSIYVEKAYQTSITKLEYSQKKQILISSSRGKSIKIWELPSEWRDSKIVAEEKKFTGRKMNEYSKEKVLNAVKMAAEDSDEDDLAGWHLDQ